MHYYKVQLLNISNTLTLFVYKCIIIKSGLRTLLTSCVHACHQNAYYCEVSQKVLAQLSRLHHDFFSVLAAFGVGEGLH